MDAPSSSAYDAVSRLLEVYLTQRDLDTLLTLLTDDVSSVGTGGQEVALGKGAVSALYSREVAGLSEPIDYQVADYWETSPAEGVYQCCIQLKITLGQGTQTAKFSPRLTATLVERDGVLLCSQLHLSTAGQEQEGTGLVPVSKALGEELLFNNEVCGVIQYRLYDNETVCIERINQVAGRILQIPWEEVANHTHIPLSSTVCSEDFQFIRDRENLEPGESSEPAEYRVRSRDGSLIWVVGYAGYLSSFQDEAGRVYRLYQSVIIDIDARKRSELELQEMIMEQQRFVLEQQMDAYRSDIEETLQGLGIGFWYIMEDPDRGPMMFLNDAAANAMALDPDSDPAESYKEALRNILPEDQGGFRQHYQDIVELGRSEYTFRYRHSDKGLRYLQNSGWWDGIQLRGLIIDVTDRVEREERYRKALEETNAALKEALTTARQASAAKTRFLSNMSHDIRTPMNAIIGFATIATRKVRDADRVQDCLTKILDSSEHLLGLINDILDMSRIESGKTTVELSRITVSGIVRKVTALVQPQAHEKQLNFRADVKDVRDDAVYADALKVRQILLNILSNAVKFTPATGHVTLTVTQLLENPEEGCGRYRFTVKDTGVGMSEEFMAHIFEPFEREKNSTISGITGTGLGMSITKHLVDMLGGAIAVQSRPGEGSEFIVELPFRLQAELSDGQADGPDGEAEDQAPVEIAVPEGTRLLLVEDNALNREIAGELLSEAGFLVDCACNGQEAVDTLEKGEPGRYRVVLMDIQMPVMDGYDAARTIRQSERQDLRELPIIAMTANAFREDREAALAAGMNDHLPKPFNLREAEILLARYLR